jgi:hypothetical protein
MKLNELFSEADPNELGPMNDKMRDVLSNVDGDDKAKEKAEVDAKDKEKLANKIKYSDSDEMKEYLKLLKSHDWTYEYSDDHSVWQRGSKQSDAIRRLGDKVDPDRELYKKHSPFYDDVKDESQYTKTRDKEDYLEKRKALQDLQANPNTAKDPELQKEIQKRKAALDKDTNEHLDLLDIIKLAGMEESATAGATSAGNIATVDAPHLSPGKARGKKSYTGDPWGGKSGTKAPPQPKVKQPKTAQGTAKNALDMKNSIFGENPVRR